MDVIYLVPVKFLNLWARNHFSLIQLPENQPKERLVFYLILLVSLPVFLINLGVPPFLEDEGIRSLVAMEMDLSGNLITPTLNGEPYFNKPPLYNWILLSVFNSTGVISELTARFPTVIFLYLFTLTIYLFVRRHLSEKTAILSALLFLTCGRILFWDSMLALIDICFSWVVFLMFCWIYEQHRRRHFLALYLGAYFLATIAFFLKALPALVFLGFTLLAVQIKDGTWKKLFGWQHFAGMGLMASFFGLYLFLYSRHSSIEDLLVVFVSESTKRTVIEHGLLDTLLQIFMFPFEMLYHFLPWSLLGLLFFAKGALRKIWNHEFISFCAVVFMANIWIYWTSPAIYPRYLFMLAPLFFTAGIFLYFELSTSWMKKVVDVSLMVLGVGVVLASGFAFFAEETAHTRGLWWKWSIPVLVMVLCLLFMLRKPQARMIGLAVFLLAARLGYDLIVLPLRVENRIQAETKQDATRIGKNLKGEEFFIYHIDSMKYDASFYISLQTERILQKTDQLTPGGYYLVNPYKYPILFEEAEFEFIDSIRVKRKEKYFYLINTE